MWVQGAIVVSYSSVKVPLMCILPSRSYSFYHLGSFVWGDYTLCIHSVLMLSCHLGFALDTCTYFVLKVLLSIPDVQS